MKKHRSHHHPAAVIAAALAVAGGALPAHTAQAQESAEGVLEEVMVTASRREESLQDVAIAVSVVNVDDFVDAGLSSLTDILPYVPGVSVVDSGAPFQNAVYMRGINAFLSAGVVSYVDEIPFGSSTVYSNPTPLDGTLLDLGTLEVLKGPQGTLYGSSAMGGILKFNTREASLENWSGSISADLSSTNGGGLNQLYRANVNGPVATDTLGVSFTAFWKDKTGYIDNVAVPVDGWDDYEYYGGSGNLRWTPSERLEITLQGMYQKSTQDGLATVQANYAQDQLLPGKGAGEPWYGRYETGDAAVNPSEYEANLIGLTIDYDFDFATLTSITSMQEMSFIQSLDVSVPFASFADLFFPESAPHSSAVLVGDLGFDKWTQELRLTSKDSEQFEWIVGAFYTDEEGFNIQDLVITPTAPLYFANFPSNYDELSLFANGTWFFTPNLDASVGVRYSDYSNNVELQTVGPLIAPLPRTDISDSVTNLLFNVRYRATDHVSFYGRAASGYRPGGANFAIIDQGTGQPITNPLFEPDELWSYEAGVKGSSPDGRVNYDVAVYYIDWRDYIISVTRGGLNVAGNADRAVSTGVEASLGFAVTDALTLTGLLSWGRAELAKDEPDLGGADGDQLPGTPEWTALVDVDYRFSIADLPAYAGVAWRYKGGMPVGFPGYTDSSGVYWPPSAPRLELDSYNLVDLRAGISLGTVDLSLYVTNLFDEWAWANFTPSFVSPSLGTPTRPRTIGAVARWNFF